MRLLDASSRAKGGVSGTADQRPSLDEPQSSRVPARRISASLAA